MELKVKVSNHEERVFNTKDLGDLKLTGQQCIVGDVNTYKVEKMMSEAMARLGKFTKLKEDYLKEDSDINSNVVKYYDETCTIAENRLKRLQVILDSCSNGNKTVYVKDHMLIKDCLSLEANEELETHMLLTYRKDSKFPYVYNIKLTDFTASTFIDKVIQAELSSKGEGLALIKALEEKGIDTTFRLLMNLTFMFRDFYEGIAPEHTFRGKTIKDCTVTDFENVKADIFRYADVVTEKILDRDGIKFLRKDCGNGLSCDLIYNINVAIKTLKTGIYKTLIDKIGVYPLYFIDGRLVVASLTKLKTLEYDLDVTMGDDYKVSDTLKAVLFEIK